MPKYIYLEKGLKVNGKTIVRPKFAHIRKVSSNEFIKHVAHGDTWRKSQLIASLMDLSRELCHMLAEGNSVELEGIGIFTPTLKMKEEKQPFVESETGEQHRSNAQSIEFGTIRFRPCKQLVKECKSRCNHLEHDAYLSDSQITISRTSRDRRIALLKDYLDEHNLITVKDYAELTGLSHTSASRELRIINSLDAPILERKGRGSHIFYIKAAQKD